MPVLYWARKGCSRASIVILVSQTFCFVAEVCFNSAIAGLVYSNKGCRAVLEFGAARIDIGNLLYIPYNSTASIHVGVLPGQVVDLMA